jgi:GNAT superfamily N-acetyltransferase
MTTVIAGSETAAAPGRPGWTVEPVRPGDGRALDGLFARCSPDTVERRFFAPVRALPPAYARGVLAARPEEHDAVIAHRGSRAEPVGLGSLAAPCEPGGPAELGLLVVDFWQRNGAGGAMLDVLAARARTRGVTHVLAFVLPGRSALLGVLARRFEPVRHTYGPDGLTGVYKLG